MEKLVKYDESDDENKPVSAGIDEKPVAVGPTNLESEWENFEKMLAGGANDNKSETRTVLPESSPETTNVPVAAPLPAPSTAPPVHNPYAYLSYLSANQPEGNSTSTSSAQEMEKQLEEFLEKTAQAALDTEEGNKKISPQPDDAGSGSHSDSEHSGTESGTESDHSNRSRSGSPAKDKTDTKSSTDQQSPEDKTALLKQLNEMNKPEKADSSHRRRRSGSRSRHSRSRRSRSRSRRSRSRSHSRRHRRKRPSSRSRHGGSRRRRRSGSRHRRSSHRSRSPRRRRDSDRHGRRRRSHRRSRSRERRDPNRKAQFAAIPTNAAPPRTEDFKARMKRELQQAAKDAMAGKGQATPQQALLQTMAAMHAKAQELTGVEVPKFYNQAAINPLKFAEQQQKRKLLWSKASQNKEQSLQKFQGTEVIADEKYRKLMGIKGEIEVTDMSEEQKQKQTELFQKLDQEYALARITTHTHRGMGLGVVSSIAAQTANEQFNRP